MSHETDRRAVTAFAPATVANVAAGFDVLGFAADGPGDRVTVRRRPEGAAPGPTIAAIEGASEPLPTRPDANCATAAIAALCRAAGIGPALEVRIHKGIPLGSGMGGSAASAVAAALAAATLLGLDPSPEALMPAALAGEAVASGAAHADNVAPCLYGGLTAVVRRDPPRVRRIPIPRGLWAVLVHPRIRVDTRAARAALDERIPLALHVEQSMALAGLIAGCYEGDRRLVAASMRDLVAGPVRARAIPGFDAARDAALAGGALGFAVSGSGPAVFAWADDESSAATIEAAVVAALSRAGATCRGRRFALDQPGARIVDAIP